MTQTPKELFREIKVKLMERWLPDKPGGLTGLVEIAAQAVAEVATEPANHEGCHEEYLRLRGEMDLLRQWYDKACQDFDDYKVLQGAPGEAEEALEGALRRRPGEFAVIKCGEDLQEGDLVKITAVEGEEEMDWVAFKADPWVAAVDQAAPGGDQTVEVPPESYPCTQCQGVVHKTSSRIGTEHLPQYQEEQRALQVQQNVEEVPNAQSMGRG